MNKLTSYLLATVSLALIGLAGCEPGNLGQPVSPQTQGTPRLNAACTAFGYADSVFYYREQATPYLEMPTMAQTGRYGAYPGGMSIDPSTGAINVNASESGLKYRVWFVPTGSVDTCLHFVTISGINYHTKLYQLAANDTLAEPFYNAIRTFVPPCTDDDDDDDRCEFDDGSDDDDGDGTADEPLPGQEVIPQGIAISKTNGAINLRQTVNNGTFGATPVNGRSKLVRIYYRLNDASNKALNYIDVTLHWYATLSDVPTALLNQINDKRAATLRRGIPDKVTAYTVDEFAMESYRPRPPDVVLVGR